MPRLQSQAARVAIVLSAAAFANSHGRAQDVPQMGSLIPLNAGAEMQSPRDLYLEVFINGTSVKLVGDFKVLPGKGLAATPKELTEVGVKPAKTARAEDGLIHLDQLPDVSYKVDEVSQRLYVTTTNDGRAVRVVDIGGRGKQDRINPQSGYGAVLNYSLFASSNTLFEGRNNLFQGISGGFDARVFSPYGTLSHSFIVGYSNSDFDGFTRLNTTWTYSDPNRLLTYKAGDLVSGGLSWTRPVYLGGLQVARNFHLRSDLVTLPLPSFEGTAAVPSTLEVYTHNTRTYTGNVPVGPFQVVNLPTYTGAGEAQVVLRDALVLISAEN